MRYIPAIVSLAATLTGVSSARANGCGYPSPGQAIVFEDAGRNGYCSILGEGRYPSPGSFAPVRNDELTGVDVAWGERAVLSEHDNFGGHQLYMDGGWFYDLWGNLNDMTSAIEVFPALGGPMAAWFAGNYPNDAEPYWSEGVQGIAHGGDSWFIAQTTTISKIRFSSPLGSPSPVKIVGVPSAMSASGYDHFGDPDQANGYLFVPVQKRGGGLPPVLAVFRTDDDISFVGYQAIPYIPASAGAWVAYRAGSDTFFLSAGSLSASDPLYVYQIDWTALAGGTVHLIPVGPWYLYERNWSGIRTINTMQGGVFNAEGTLLYTSSGYCDTDAGGLHVFAIDDGGYGILQAASENGWGFFNFEHHGGAICDEEPEGMDWLDTNSQAIPGFPSSQLHVILMRNEAGTDDVYLKHYQY